MKMAELVDLTIDHGSPIEAAEATGRKEEIVELIEDQLRQTHGDLILAQRENDELGVGFNRMHVEMFTKILNALI